MLIGKYIIRIKVVGFSLLVFSPTPLTVSHLLSVKKRDRSQDGDSDETKIWMATVITFFLFLSCRIF